ncbi:MAG: UDP-N-acetylmuramoyl-L-alanyl-D-glutamate--2,6-diaminopimelate ligase [Proteobacteria bacterium]|nr:UDP-N-acetylmuramoyl-L-alanyl-D-glutamate--2,6-diaminopimelate ligase [Pseudomonadota bacterium]
MKLSTLVKAIDPISINALWAGRIEQSAKRNEKEKNAPGARRQADLPDLAIESIHYRAQEVLPGGMFVAIKGQTADGHDFMHQALQKGAVAVVIQKEPPQPYLNECLAQSAQSKPIIIRVSDTRKALADLAARFFGDPSENMTLIGITGTNGKTTVAYLIESVLLQAGFNTGVIGTINYRYADKIFSNPMTTPESLDLQRILAQMHSEGVTHVVIEASSHAMDLYRIRRCWFDVAVFTNLSQDHLDFHGDMQSYWSSKKGLFTEYLTRGPKKEKAVAVINCDDPRGRELAGSLPMPVIKIGSVPDGEIKAENFQCKLIGTAGKVATPEGSFDFKTPLVGVHNVENILSTAGVAIALKIAPQTIKAGIEALSIIPGRLESIENSTGRFVYVDYAHTPDALENAVTAIKEIAPARIICVFGCGGDRDREKRPMMGEIVSRLCDLAVVTSDNPRTENPLAIIEQILPGTKKANGVEYSDRDLQAGFEKNGFVVEPDRRRAIELGIKASRPDDAVLIAGKGHETYQILGNTTIDFDDREEARKVLHELNSN